MRFENIKNWCGFLAVRSDEYGFRAETKVNGIEYTSPYLPTEEEATQSLYDICLNPKGYKHEPYILPVSAIKKTLTTETLVKEPILTEKEQVEKALRIDPMTDQEFEELKVQLSTSDKLVADGKMEVV